MEFPSIFVDLFERKNVCVCVCVTFQKTRICKKAVRKEILPETRHYTHYSSRWFALPSRLHLLMEDYLRRRSKLLLIWWRARDTTNEERKFIPIKMSVYFAKFQSFNECYSYNYSFPVNEGDLTKHKVGWDINVYSPVGLFHVKGNHDDGERSLSRLSFLPSSSSSS